jgi:hypothetical protein
VGLDARRGGIHERVWWPGVVTSAGFVAVPATWGAAGRDVERAAASLAGVTTRLCEALAGSWGAWGNDEIGEAFCNGADGKPGFGHAADSLLTALAQAVNLLAQAGWGMRVSGVVFAGSDAHVAATLGARSAAAARVPQPAVYRLPAVSRRLVAGDPPPPEWEFLLQLLARLVAGCQYPDGNFGSLATIESELTTAASVISEVAGSLRQAAASVTSVNAGNAADTFGSFAKGLVAGLEWLAGQCTALASSAENLLRQKQAARIEFWASLVFLAVMFAAAQALAFFSFGASEAGFLAAVTGQGVGLRAMLMFVLRMVIEGIAFAAGDDVIDQFARMHEDLQHGFNEGELWTAAGTGAVASLVTFGLGSTLHAGAGMSTTLATVAGWMDHDAASPLAARARAVATRAVINGLGGTAGNVAGQAIFDDGRINLAQAAEGGFTMAVMAEGTEAGNRWAINRAAARYNNADPSAPVDFFPAISEAQAPSTPEALNATGHEPADAPQADAGSADATARADGTTSGATGTEASADSGGEHTSLAPPGPDLTATYPASVPHGLADMPTTHPPADPAVETVEEGSASPPSASAGVRLAGDLGAAVYHNPASGTVDDGRATLTASPAPDLSRPAASPSPAHLASLTTEAPATTNDAADVSQPGAGSSAHGGGPGDADPSRSQGGAGRPEPGSGETTDPRDPAAAPPGSSRTVRDLLSRDPEGSARGRHAASSGGSADGDAVGSHTDAVQPADGRADGVRDGSARGRTADGQAEAAGDLIVVRRHARAQIQADRAGEGRPDLGEGAVAGTAAAGLSAGHEPVTVTKVVEIDGDRPSIPRVHNGRFGYGVARDAFGEPLPVRHGVLRADQVGQGALGVCGRLSSLRASIDYLARYRPGALDDMIVEKPDGTVAVRFYDVKVYKNGVAVPTGLVWEVRMGRDVPVRIGQGQGPNLHAYAKDQNLPIYPEGLDRPAYANRSEGVLWPMLWEKAVAAVTYHWSPERAALHAQMRPKVADLRGLELINKGTMPYEKAEVLAQITGEPAYIIKPGTAEEAVALWKDLTGQGLPVAVGLKPAEPGERNEYNAPGGFHAYDVVDVVHGTAAEASRELAGFQTARGYQRLTDHGTLGSHWTKPHEPDPSAAAVADGGQAREIRPGSPEAVQAQKDNLVTDRVLMRNPHNKNDVKPIPVHDLDKVMNGLATATIAPPGKFDYLMNTDVRVEHPELPPGHAGEGAYAELPAVPLYEGIPSARQVIRGDLVDNDVLVAIGAVARTHPELIQGMLKQVPEGPDGRGAGVTMVLHEDEYHGLFKVHATGRTFELRMTPDLPVDPVTGHTIFANAEAAGASWAAFMEKGFAGLSEVKQKIWSPDRIAADAGLDLKGSSSVRGYAALAKGYAMNKMAEVLTQITGEKTQVLAVTDPQARLPYLADITSRFQVFYRTVDFSAADFSTGAPDGVPTHGLHSLTAYEVTGVQDGRIMLLDGDQVTKIPGDEAEKLFGNRYLTLQWPAASVGLSDKASVPGSAGTDTASPGGDMAATITDATAAGDTSIAQAAPREAAPPAPKSDDRRVANAAPHTRAPDDPSAKGVSAHHAGVPGQEPARIKVDATHPRHRAARRPGHG